MAKVLNLYKKYEELINYVIVGVLTTIVSLLTYYICVFTILNPKVVFQLQLANIISWLSCVTFAYFTNRKYVFKSKNTNKLKEGLNFYLSRVSTLLIDMLCMLFFVTVLKINDKVAKIIVQFVILILNYIFSKLFVFKNKKEHML